MEDMWRPLLFGSMRSPCSLHSAFITTQSELHVFGGVEASMQRFCLTPLCLLAASACATSQDTADETVTLDPRLSTLLGYWRVADAGTVFRLERCDEGADYCGALIVHTRAADARDYLIGDPTQWGRPLCESKTLFQVQAVGENEYTGRYYRYQDGEEYDVRITQTAPDQLSIHRYHGARPGEVIDIAVSAAISGGLSLISAGSFAARSTLGEAMGEGETWHRLSGGIQTCEPPVQGNASR